MLCEVNPMNRPFTIRHILTTAFLLYIHLQLYAPNVASAQYLTAAVETAGDVKMTPFYWIVGIVGGSIAITLTYVGWKKYKGEETKESNKDSNS
ncbi:hypothetical protein EU245_05715 [Lentibacillus lipolyticus]|nr:hypothetical protein EU245_05715 [Lentibacillus lipolyticus]